MPIELPNGAEPSEIVLPDGSTASEVVAPDGSVVWPPGDAIPDSGLYPAMPREETAVASYENVQPDPDVTNPVLTAADVTDSDAQFVADPFLYVPDENDSFSDWHMFLEVRDPAYAVIGHATSSDQGLTWTYNQIVADPGSHVSYPFVTREGSDYYMIVDNAGDPPILYKADSFPTDWQNLGAYLPSSSFSYQDFTFFKHNSRLWMIVGTGDGGFASGLRVFYSDEGDTIESATWTAHPNNPVVSGRDYAARGAGRGIVQNDGSLIIWYQDSVAEYGDKVRVYEVDTLTTTTFSDTELTSYSPVLEESGSGWNATAMHHYDPWYLSNEGYWRGVVDGKDSADEYSIGIYRGTAAPDAFANITTRLRMSEGSGTTLSDSIDSQPATLNGATWVSNSKYTDGFAASFDGTNDYLISDNAYGVGNPQFSVCGWFNLTGWDDYGAILTTTETGDFTNPSWDFPDNGSGEFRLRFNGTDIGSPISLSTGTDYFIGIAGDGDEGSWFVWDANSQITSQSGTASRPTGDYHLASMTLNGTSEMVGGIVDDVSTSTTTALTESEFEKIWQETMR